MHLQLWHPTYETADGQVVFSLVPVVSPAGVQLLAQQNYTVGDLLLLLTSRSCTGTPFFSPHLVGRYLNTTFRCTAARLIMVWLLSLYMTPTSRDLDSGR
jgi:hypothetical protein